VPVVIIILGQSQFIGNDAESG